ncbi:ABC transporter ATP-binding protein [Bifidobacterium pullorum subsp. saeculare]|uniref:ABC transporter ATP-binding protein n=1 Tax=Bifidobacterium pullorum TaxID=78448 RepID=UPI00195D6698|nr:ABC transporter ATP-binding protein [Bifidobacterium pullorum]MBM6706385.1 ABC transporter ATP-binding protein [Bifidobacterium pullorum subsp. saeculare]
MTRDERNGAGRGTVKEDWRRTARALGIWWRIAPQWLVAITVNAALTACGPYATIWLSARLIDELAGARDPSRLAFWAVLTLGVTAVVSLATAASLHWKNREDGANIWWASSRLYMDAMMGADYPDVDDQRTYDLFSTILQNRNFNGWGLDRIPELLTDAMTAVFRIIGGIGLTVGLFLTPMPEGSPLRFLGTPWCGALFCVLLLTIVAASAACASGAERVWLRHADDGKLGNRIFNTYAPMPNEAGRAMDMRMYAQQERVVAPLLSVDDTYGVRSSMARDARGPMGLFGAGSRALTMTLEGAAYLFVCAKAWAGAFGVGAVTQYVGAITNCFAGVASLLTVAAEARANAAFLVPTFQFLDTPHRMYQGSLTTEKRTDREYDVEFRDVSFRYPGSQTWALRHVNLRFRIGRRLAVVGENGSGKTTFIKLLCRLYDPTEGEILLNGIDIRKYRYDQYLDLFSVVFQDFHLLAQPLGRNVAAGERGDADRARDCLKKAGFGERLATLPKGLDTPLYRDLDPEGVEISGGEAQKIALARAIYKDAPFVVLDEPTAALDPVAEAEVYEGFDRIVEDRTAVYISHRLSSCRFCDEIAVFDHGSIVQFGTHDELVGDESGTYHRLWQAQAQYYVERRADNRRDGGRPASRFGSGRDV